MIRGTAWEPPVPLGLTLLMIRVSLSPARARTGRVGFLAALASAGLLAACGSATEPGAEALQFEPAALDLALAGDTVIRLENTGTAAVGPVSLVVTEVVDGSGTVGAPTVSATPADIPTLNPGDVREIALSIAVPGSTPDGVYRTTIEALIPETGRLATFTLTFLVDNSIANQGVVSLSIDPGPSSLRQGDALSWTATATDAGGAAVAGANILWSISTGTGFVDPSGTLVPYDPGTLTLVARAGAGRDSVTLAVTPRNLSGSFTAVGQGSVTDRFTSDLWAFGNVVYTGTWGIRTVGAQSRAGNTLYAWRLDPNGVPTLTDSVTVDARVVNDVKIRSDGQLAVLTHESSLDLQNGITLLDLTDPEHPGVIGRTTATLTTGVHNAWLDGTYLYLVVDGISPSSGLRILDVSDPANPVAVASFYGGSSFLHDVYVRDGLAFLSHWDAGLIILDVGNGIAGGSPTNPVEVGRTLTQGGQTHNAWYWPAAGYVFVGEEDFSTPGRMHVVDVSDLTAPREVATFAVPGTTPHNFWLDENSGTLYLAWYTNGIQALDVNGTLLGALDRQGRVIASLEYAGTGGACASGAATSTCNWAPQLHNGIVYLSDMNTGIWAVRPGF